MIKYTARLVKGGANSWAVEFRHPVLKDRHGKQGRKIRRGLGTVETEAVQIVDDVNRILQDESYWALTEQRKAMNEFREKAVHIFYDQMEEESVEDSWDIREQYISMPKSSDGFARVMLLGTTGAGKTTVIRQLVGTDPDEVSFPAISTSRTTTCNTEFIFSAGFSTRVIVTFISQSQTRKLIEESIWEAFKRAVIGEEKKRIAKALLSHPENRFRLSYVLGQYRIDTRSGKTEEPVDPPYPDQEVLSCQLDYILSEIELLASEARNACPVEGDEIDEAIDLLYEDFIREETERFHELVDHILVQIKQRFLSITVGDFLRDTRGWPLYWTYESDDKAEVLTQMRWFAGNDGRRFGQLLAPVVDGIRIEGPFKPSWWNLETSPRLVLIDGEGIGHDSGITTSLSMELTTRFREMDVIAVIDNAAQPMLDIPKVILRDVASRGHTDKLVIAYTRFDQVGGSNMLDDEERREHVLTIQDGAIEAFQDSYNLNPKMVRQLREHLAMNSFFFPNTNELKKPPYELQEEMENFINACIRIAEPSSPQGVFPVPEYDYGRLVLAISETEKLFMEKWLGLLGFESSRYPKQHWTRIKALANRLAYWTNATSYKELEPASDIASLMVQRMDTFLRSPKRWCGNLNPTETEQQFVINKIASIVSEKINMLVFDRLKVQRLKQWIEAYGYSGVGSTKQRAISVRSIFEQAVPQPRIMYDELTGDLLSILQEIIDSALKSVAEDVFEQSV